MLKKYIEYIERSESFISFRVYYIEYYDRFLLYNIVVIADKSKEIIKVIYIIVIITEENIIIFQSYK